MRLAVVHQRLWLVVCAWCFLCCTAPAQASWEAYQQAGEAAYNDGRYAEAERMFLAAVREARYFGPQDPRLDISLNKLALLRVVRGQYTLAQRRSQRTARHTGTARQRRVAHHGRPRHQPRTALRHVKPQHHKQAWLSRRSGEHKKGTRLSISRPERRSKRPRAALHRARPTRRAVAALRHERQQESVRQGSSRRASHLRRGHQLQRPRITRHRAELKHPEHHARHSSKRQAARSPRRAMPHVGQPHRVQL
jgi:hypothetical protein